MRYHDITHDDLKNGDGVRVVLWVSGCEHHCPECQNPITWDKDCGIVFDDSALNEIYKELDKDYISGITLSGGDPLAPYNLESVYHLIYHIKQEFPNKTVWVYTGYDYEFIHDELHWKGLDYIDVLVDGEYKKDLRDVNLKWRGSSNQRVIDVQKSLKEGKVVLHCE